MTRPRRSTLIRQARQAVTAAKRSEIFGNKKPGIAPGILNFDVAGRPTSGPATNYPHSPIRSMNDEICR